MSEVLQGYSIAQLADVLAQHESAILEDWLKEMSTATRRSDLMRDSEIR